MKLIAHLENGVTKQFDNDFTETILSANSQLKSFVEAREKGASIKDFGTDENVSMKEIKSIELVFE